ncbi:MAG TPA: GNAT family N-acetyltransferase [Polyangiaceae bacterium]|nr:GNAT family N-acetyltransferase [Polyangiaceae bacterium]
MSDFLVRRANSHDLPAVVELIRALSVFENLPGPDDAAAARLTGDFAANHFGLTVAERGAEVVAYALYFMTYSTFLARPSLYLEDLFVRPDARQLGIATALLRDLARLARESGCGRFEWTVLDWNEKAIRFYRGLGAELLPDWRVCRLTSDGIAFLAR